MAPKQGGVFLVVDFPRLDFLGCSITRGGGILKDNYPVIGGGLLPEIQLIVGFAIGLK